MIGPEGAIFWLVAAVIFFVIEGATTQLVCIWFAAGSLVAMLLAFLGGGWLFQLIAFLLSSLIVLFIGRPLLKSKLFVKVQATNADMVIGQIAVVRDKIDNIAQTGRVLANGLDWSARTQNGEVLEPGDQALVKSIEGVKLIVTPLISNV